MNDTGVIDQFLSVFSTYIDSGFGLLGGEVGFLSSTLIVIDVTIAALFWAWGADEDVVQRLVKKTLYIGVFAFIIGNFQSLATIMLRKLRRPRAQGKRRRHGNRRLHASRRRRRDGP